MRPRNDVAPFDPVAIAPELGNELANLELMPRTLNRRKGRKVGARQIAYAGKFATVGILKPQTMARISCSHDDLWMRSLSFL